MNLRAILSGVLLAYASVVAAHEPVTMWKLVRIGGDIVRSDAAPTLQIQDGRVYGTGGCNAYSGAYTQSGNRIVIAELESAAMACRGPGTAEALRIGARHLEALPGVRTVARAGDRLILTGPNGFTLEYTAGDPR